MGGVSRRFAALAVMALVCVGCATSHRAPAPPPPDPRTQMAALEYRILDLVAAERRKIDPNAKELRLDSELVGAARRHSSDMAQKKYLAHAAPNGETTASIIMDEDAQFQGLLGENIAAVYFTPAAGIDVNAMARQFVDLWLKSPHHRENIATAAYDRTGVGAATIGDTVYVTQLFATDLGLPPPPIDAVRPQAVAPSAPNHGPAVPTPGARPGN
ncbi:MAG TPA: CAP domain-containing protein [Rhizomicrobium sp.]|jgi:uncharacterized protein YkwD|nr:CAP domain-containing protein [Rhizomicrobium sp.]